MEKDEGHQETRALMAAALET
ncbi:hypothetical protein CCACVL1_04058 [Corchorus capsularis]|uniref:Uncharacterized protein n=1 Tax=Corchorus capsularis TaxID=210143 RepID=A0A1R3JVL4_COCAP|nr:hypothetical protein CCACVL1_04058 [Corchorus capsularis]